MKFVFNDRKTAQAAAYLLKRHDGSLPYIVLIKLLYLADRQSLLDRGYPITGDRMVSMPKGPVLSEVLNLISYGSFQEVKTSSAWFEYVSDPVQYEVALATQDPDQDELSRNEIGLLDQIYEQYGKMDRWALVEFTHHLPEWTDPQGSSLQIRPEEILLGAGRSQDEVTRLSADADEHWNFSQALARHR